jgi:UDP-N-acetylglucosamine acyltransferase
MDTKIHPTAIIEKGAILEGEVEIEPYVIIEKDVRIGKKVRIGPFSHIKGNTEIRDNTFIGTGAVIGEVPQILRFKRNVGKVYIGKNNIIREYVTIHTSSAPDKITYIGDNNYLMGFAHIAHDCVLENDIIICNGSLLAGHVKVGSNAFISGNVVVHQFTRIGKLSMIAGLARVNQDVPPFMMVVGDSKVWGINLVGIKRAGLGADSLKDIKKAFNIIYRSRLPIKNAVEKLKNINSSEVKEIVEFILSSKRGICGPKRSTLKERIFLDYPYFLRNKIVTYDLFLKKVFKRHTIFSKKYCNIPIVK